MKRVLKSFILAVVFCMAAAVFSGCALQYGDGLLALPSLPAEYVELQEEINKVLATGAVSAAAESGANRQSIQLVDIDGDGENETIAFFRRDDGSYLIKAYKKDADKYVEIGSAEAVGLSFHSIYYPVASVTGQKCLAVCWGIDESSNYGMDVYSFGPDGMENILNVQYSGILVGDFYENSLDELCFAVKDQVTGQMSLRVYAVKGKTYVFDSETLLCEEARSISKMTLGSCAEGTRAIFLDSAAYGGGYVTDVVVADGQSRRTQNISRRRDGETGMMTWRSIEIFSEDIDDDGIIEVPVASSMMSAIYPDEKNKLNWLEYDKNGMTVKMKTYHMPTDGWYLKWMDSWDDTVVVQTTRYSRMVKTVFFLLPDELTISSIPGADESNTLLTVYIFSGDNKQAYTSVYEATEIMRRDGLVYAFALGSAPNSKYTVDNQDVLDGFARIENEWTSEAN